MKNKMNHTKGKKKKIGSFLLIGVFAVVCIVLASFLLTVSSNNSNNSSNRNNSSNNSNNNNGNSNNSNNGSNDSNIQNDEEEERNVVTIQGKAYTPKSNIETYLLIGVDSTKEDREDEDFAGFGQCDELTVLVIDKAANTYARLPINRDTVTEVRSLGENGEDLGTSQLQIALAHATGKDEEQRCENTVEAVSTLLNGQKINGYACLDLDSIAALNHLVGGVTVTIEDDFSKADPTLIQGETIKLSDEQAVSFVRGRMEVGDGTNEGRMRRHDAYINGLKEVVLKKSESDNSYPLTIFNGLRDYMTTNINGNAVSRISKALIKNEDLGKLEIKGKNKIDDYGFNAFTVDKDSLNDVITQLFYKEKM